MSCEGDCHYNVLLQKCTVYHYDRLLRLLMAVIIKALRLPHKEPKFVFAKATQQSHQLIHTRPTSFSQWRVLQEVKKETKKLLQKPISRYL